MENATYNWRIIVRSDDSDGYPLELKATKENQSVIVYSDLFSECYGFNKFATNRIKAKLIAMMRDLYKRSK